MCSNSGCEVGTGARACRPRGRPSAANIERSQFLVYSTKAHGTIWGKGVRGIADFPSADVRRVFEAIVRTPGVIKVILRQFSRKDAREHVGGLVMESTTPNVLEGKVFDKGEKGSVQTFQIHVQADDEKPRIMEQCENALREAQLWAG